MTRQIELDYSFGYIYDKSKLIVMYPVGTNVMSEEEYEMEVEVAFLEDGIEVAFEENDINEANEAMKPLQNFLMKPSKIIPFVTSIKDSTTKEELSKLMCEFDEEYEIKENYLNKGYEIKDVYHVFENVAKYIPKESLETLNILKIEKDKFDMERFIKHTKENLDEVLDSNLIPVNMLKSSLTNRLFVRNDKDTPSGTYVVFATHKGLSNDEILCANKEIIVDEEVDLADLEINNIKDAGYMIEELNGEYTFKIANYNSQTENNNQIAQVVDYCGVLKIMMINYVNQFIK
ncbi:MAG: hypothetical protein RRZ84_02285 [Romboutsia sp.]